MLPPTSHSPSLKKEKGDGYYFEDYLKAQKKRNVRQIVCYAKRYATTVLETRDASILTTLPSATRLHVMEALAAYSKHKGSYQRWQEIRKAYSLKWTSDNASLHAMQRFFNPDLSLNVMIQKIKEMVRLLPL